MSSENVSQLGQQVSAKPRSVVFANSKGGVGKSTLALIVA